MGHHLVGQSRKSFFLVSKMLIRDDRPESLRHKEIVSHIFCTAIVSNTADVWRPANDSHEETNLVMKI